MTTTRPSPTANYVAAHRCPDCEVRLDGTEHEPGCLVRMALHTAWEQGWYAGHGDHGRLEVTPNPFAWKSHSPHKDM